MASDKGRALHRTHVAQLFDDATSLGESVGAFFEKGYQGGETLMLVARPAHSIAILRWLSAHRYPVDDMIASHQLTVLDATAAMGRLCRTGRPDPARFDAQIGTRVRSLLAQGHRLRIYGEIVDLFAEQGQFDLAHDLEKLWNALAETCEFALFCGYQSHHFGDPRSAPSLHALCSLHTHVAATSTDMLGAWLLSEREKASRNITQQSG